MDESWIGKTLGGCQIVRELARGGMATIYLANQASVGRTVAVKVMSAHLLGDPTFMERFTREVSTTARLQHPHIVPIFDYGQEGNLPYIVMAYVPGGSLGDRLAGGPLPLDAAARLVGQMAQALDYAHARGIIHRDIKPANVLLDAQQNAVLADFGIARVLAASEPLTRDVLVGTPSYLAPELVTQDQPATPSADVYGLGVTLYQMLTDELPFPGESSVQMMWAHVNEPAPLVGPRRPDLPEGVDAVVQKALAKAPEARYASAGELAADLTAVAAGQPPQHAEAAPPELLVSAPPGEVRQLEEAVRSVIDQVVKIARADGGAGGGIYLPGDQVLTCLHVVDGAPGLAVRFRTGEQVAADVRAADRALDLALLSLHNTPQTLDADRLNQIVFDFPPLVPGAALAAIGHPLNLDWAVTGGHFNGLRLPGEESLRRFGVSISAPLVQVDVAINPGNSGGPLIDTQGRLVGLADAVINPALADNVGFAIAGQAAHAFWQAHRSDAAPLVAYTCGHHHPEGGSYCPLTGKPAPPSQPEPAPPSDAVRYTCGHFHPPGLAYCPLTGKPVQPRVGAAGGDTPPAQAIVTCTNCGREFVEALAACPFCGKPRR